MAQSETTPGVEKVILLTAAALRIADEIGLQDAAIDLNAALLKLCEEREVLSVLRDSAARFRQLDSGDDDEL